MSDYGVDRSALNAPDRFDEALEAIRALRAMTDADLVAHPKRWPGLSPDEKAWLKAQNWTWLLAESLRTFTSLSWGLRNHYKIELPIDLEPVKGPDGLPRFYAEALGAAWYFHSKADEIEAWVRTIADCSNGIGCNLAEVLELPETVRPLENALNTLLVSEKNLIGDARAWPLFRPGFEVVFAQTLRAWQQTIQVETRKHVDKQSRAAARRSRVKLTQLT